MSTARIYTPAELIPALQRQFPLWSVQGPCVMNARYCAVTRSWVETQYSGYLWNFEIARGQLAYKARGNQCEHYALRAVLEVVDLFRLLPEGSVPADAESIAVAACKYLQHAGTPQAGWHEVVLWFHDGVWNAWEPQKRRYFEFTEAERLTVQQIIMP